MEWLDYNGYNSRQMGRQIQLTMLPADVDALLTEIRSHAPVEIVIRDEDSADATALTSVSEVSEKSDSILILWNKNLMPTLKRKWIDLRTPGYYSVDYFTLPVLEFSLSVLTEWQGKPALTQGRIYGQFDGKPVEFEKWFEQIVRYIRKSWRKNPVALLGGYVGPAASEWFASGGLVLPMFVPPVTPEWTRVMKQQHTAKKWQHWTKFASVETPSIRKSRKRHQDGLCIGCGKRPCQCKRLRSKRRSIA